MSAYRAKTRMKIRNKRMKKSRFTYALVIIAIICAVGGYIYMSSASTPENRKTGVFDRSTAGLPHAEDVADVIHLADGDTYDLSAHYVVKDVGNRQVRMIGYNGSVPGPFIHVDEGAEITIEFSNDLDIETTIHSHGLRLDFPNDGTPGLVQYPIKPGETFTYVLKFPDAGTYWYHPHVREDYAQELGLYGNYQVNPVRYELQPVNQEINLIVDDILLEGDQLSPFFKDKTNFAVMGRFGNVMLVNGETEYTQTFQRGDVIRMNITNVANARPFELTIPGAQMKLVGSDVSVYEREEFIDRLLITPSERYIVDVYFQDSGVYTLTHTSHDLSMGEKVYEMATFEVGQEASDVSFAGSFQNLAEYPIVSQEIGNLDEYLYAKPDKSLRLTLETGSIDLGSSMDRMPCHRMPDGEWMGDCDEQKKKAWLEGLAASDSSIGGETIHWEDHLFAVNRKATNEDIEWIILDEGTDKRNGHIDDWHFDEGERVKVRIYNDPMSPHPMQHPIHFHGQRFVVLSRNGKSVDNRVWKDTTLVKVGETVDILIEMSNPGPWMAHCHIAEHLSSGMMFNFSVGEFEHSIEPQMDM